MIYSHLGTAQRREEVSRLLGRPPSEPDLAGRRRRKDAQLGEHAAVGDRLRAARRSAGLTVVGLAAKAGTGRAVIIRAEAAASRWSVPARGRWCPRLDSHGADGRSQMSTR
jgi:ribosome-binding protein aMBF1 (putative translation factor)